MRNIQIPEFNHSNANMREVIKLELKLTTDVEVDAKIRDILALFKKTGQSSGIKNQKNISPRLTWVSVTICVTCKQICLGKLSF